MHADNVVIQPEDRTWITALGLTGVADVMALPGAASGVSDDSFTIDIEASLNGPRRIRVRRRRHTRDSSVVFGLIRGVPWRESDTRLEFELLAEMLRRGIPVERPIAYGERRSCGLFNEGFIITEVPLHAESLDSAAMRHCTVRGIPEIDRRRFLKALGAEVGKMHHAGLQHGALLASNILAGETFDGEWRFTFTRPGCDGRAWDGPVPHDSVIMDLEDLAASGIGFGRLRDVVCFMRAYRREMSDAQLGKYAVRDLLAAATEHAVPFGSGLALAEAIHWVRRRVEAGASGCTQNSVPSFGSVDTFVQAIALAQTPVFPVGDQVETIAFTFRTRHGNEPPRRFNVTLAENGITIDTESEKTADLSIETDEEAWLAIVNAAAIAPEVIRNHRVRLRGNVDRLRTLLTLVEGLPRP